MKKSWLGICFVAVCVLLGGCSGATINEIAKNNLSEIVMNYFVGNTQKFSINMSSGVRENPYQLDGISNDLVEFCVLTIIPNEGVVANGVEYTVEVNEVSYEGVFENSPFDKSLASDLEIALQPADEIYVYIILNEETEIAKLECITNTFEINQTEAVDLAIEHSFDKLIDLSNDNTESIEGYCKVITTDKNLSIYFWYVSFVNTQNKIVAVVINPNTGEIVASQ